MRTTRIFPLILLLLAAVALLPAGEALRDFLRRTDAAHTAAYRAHAPAVVGLTCRATFDGRPSGFYGTGVMVSPAGLVLSNITVIPPDAHEIEVSLSDGRVIPAELVGTDRASEGALVRLRGEHEDLVYMPLADSTAAAVGDPVYSWGNPHSTIQRDGGVSLSAGLLSGRYRLASVDDQSRYRGPVLETDAAVNPGSDGGPLTDVEGNLLGIMSLGFSPRRWLGVAIPVARLREGLPELAELPQEDPAGAPGPLWSRDRALQAAATAPLRATVGIWVKRHGDRHRPPRSRDTEPPSSSEPIPRPQRSVRERHPPPPGCGSGFLVDPDGLVVTAAFNVADRRPAKAEADDRRGTVKAIHVYLADGTRHPAELLGREPAYDLAVLRVKAPEGTSLPFLPVTSAAEPQPVGSALAVLGRSEPPGAPTLNGGILSARERLRGIGYQISALINYGNVGGPVIDMDGRLVGMASHLSSATAWRQNCGVGFCLTAERLAAAVPVLAAGRELDIPGRPVIGVHLDIWTDAVGAAITSIRPDSPAERAGLREGDVITAIDDTPVRDFITLKNLILEREPGDEISVDLLRDGKTLQLSVTVGSDRSPTADDEDDDNAGDDDEPAEKGVIP